MAATDPGPARQLGPQDAAAGLVLSTEAHWNQTEADWRFFLAHGTVFGIHDVDGRLIATAALLPYPPAAWISLVLVTVNWRRRGLATLLVQQCVALAERTGLTPWLDATPAGATVYGPMGFVTTLSFQRLRLLPSDRQHSGEAIAARTSDPTRLIADDRHAMGCERSALLMELAARARSGLHAQDDTIFLTREGREAAQIGPVFAGDQIAAAGLIDTVARRERRPVLIDALDDKPDFLRHLTTHGWTVERPFRRMRYGGGATQDTARLMAVAGPEFG